LANTVNVALGLNGLTLRVLSDVKYSVTVNVVSAIVAILANIVLVPRFGALGAAYATCGTMLFHCVLKQSGCARATGVSPFDFRLSALYGGIVLERSIVVVGQLSMPGQAESCSFWFAAAASLLLLVASKRMLMVTETFPEIRRVPLIRMLFACSRNC
jgi:Na+-driven multidrug efflux pump